MAFKDEWIDRVDDVDDASAEDINMIAHAIIETNDNVEKKSGCFVWHTLEVSDGIGWGGTLTINVNTLNEYEERSQYRLPRIGDFVWDDSGNLLEISNITSNGSNIELIKSIPLDDVMHRLENVNSIWTTEDAGLDFSYLLEGETVYVDETDLKGDSTHRPNTNDLVLDDSHNLLIISSIIGTKVLLKMTLVNANYKIGNIETALDRIIEIQETLIGGNA